MKSRKLLMLYVSLLFIALFTMVMLWQISHRKPPVRDYEEIRKEGILRLITDYNPLGYYVHGDTIEGFQYELSRAIANLSGFDVQIQLEMSLSKSFEELSLNNCDVIARNIPIISEINNHYLYTEPIILNKQVLVQRTAKANNGKEPVRNHLELARHTLYIPKNSPALLRIQNLEEEIGDSIFVIEDELYSSEQLIMMVAKGDIDYTVCDQLIASKLQQQHPEIDIKTDISFTQLQSWVVRKDSPILLDSLNSWFNQIKKNGIYESLLKRYYQ